MSRSLAAPAGLLLAAAALTGSAPPACEEALSEKEALALAADAYVYGYPLVTMEMTRRIMTNVAKPEGTRAPMGQFVKARSYPDATFRDVTAPNADTLYTTSWIDVSKEPWVLGGFAAAAPGGQPGRRVLMEPVRDRLVFAGEAVHETLWGTVGGAWESGERAADAVLKLIGGGRRA